MRDGEEIFLMMKRDDYEPMNQAGFSRTFSMPSPQGLEKCAVHIVCRNVRKNIWKSSDLKGMFNILHRSKLLVIGY